MSNDLTPIEPPGWLSSLNLPEMIAGPAGKAISRLVGELADIPSAVIGRYTGRLKNKTEAEQVMSRAVAEAAAHQTVADPDLVRRAAQSFLAKELRGQSNKEAIAAKTIEDLRAHPQAETTQTPESPEAPEDDWLNVFERYAEDASSERMQSLWARVLAGQIRKPKAFSLSALRFIAELDAEAAQTFETVAPRVINGDFIPHPPLQGPLFNALLRLEEIGLISGAAGGLHKTFQAHTTQLFFMYSAGVLLINRKPELPLKINAALLTRVGREIFPLAAAEDNLESVREFAEKFPKEEVGFIIFTPRNKQPILLYNKPPEEPKKA